MEKQQQFLVLGNWIVNVAQVAALLRPKPGKGFVLHMSNGLKIPVSEKDSPQVVAYFEKQVLPLE